LITGDTIFRGTVGRWDFTGGSRNQLMHSIKNKIYTLPGDTIIRPGHGFKSTVKDEKKNNDTIRG
jgi:glyoxylase-like metal-dependent hydrolase (beta-lactamase superfamily II)